MAMTFTPYPKPLIDLIDALNRGELKIPEHQRHPTVWTLKKRQTFIDSCKKNMPCPSILIFTDASRQDWLEDGLQRLTTAKDFIQDKFSDMQSKLYSTWTEIEQHKFLNYAVPTVLYRNASEEERVEIFDRFQNGSPLRVGERLHALSYTNLVKFTKEMLMKYPDSSGKEVTGKFYESAKNVWGDIKCNDEDKPKRFTELLNCVALINGIVHGWSTDENGPKGITKMYPDLKNTLMTNIDSDMRENAERILGKLLTIYKEASEKKPLKQKKFKTVQKNIGNFTGAIVWSLKTMPDDWQRLHTMWVEFIVRYRNDNSLLDIIKNGVAKCRNWNAERWEKTYNDVLSILSPSLAIATLSRSPASATSSQYDSELDESEESEE
jgi:hypothetical protein